MIGEGNTQTHVKECVSCVGKGCDACFDSGYCFYHVEKHYDPRTYGYLQRRYRHKLHAVHTGWDKQRQFLKGKRLWDYDYDMPVPGWQAALRDEANA